VRQLSGAGGQFDGERGRIEGVMSQIRDWPALCLRLAGSDLAGLAGSDLGKRMVLLEKTADIH